MTDQVYLSFAAAFQAEHHEMNHWVQRLRQTLGDDRAWSAETAGDAAEAIEALHTHLKHHFMTEEAGGYLEEALAVAPRFSGQAAQLLTEHPQLLRQIDDISAAAKLATHDAGAWSALKVRVNDLLGKLVAHETAENQIVQQALNSGIEVE